ncbi:Two-component response regulator, SAPR family, consists of REC, wHTH and BTAD domains [Paenibacillus sophorae]|uniref:Response regulator n=2 Tax=Paenibacillus sophorae TaxID=1333845 RepID=A0A1H8MR39_9BACL|nr:response regulator [Paenibacillus sophorae]SEO19882.1 Two-component response regulator, SAPR family, consists of REC, wHTH and BTAD domains [Paenibacillus sophorae]
MYLEMMLLTDGRFQVEGKYTSARAGLEHLARSKVDVVFLDMDMPEMNGLEAGEHIQQLNSDIRIVYVTAYSEYAIEAFEIHALDYVLKPIDPDRIAKTLNYIERSIPVSTMKTFGNWRVRCFGHLSFDDGAGNDRQLKWKTAKAQELFAYLLHHRERWISKEILLETLWPDYPKDKAMTYLHTTVSQIRKLVKEWQGQISVEYALDSYRLVIDGILFDVSEFERATDREPAITEQNRLFYENIIVLYRGDYLEGYDYPWAETLRSNLLERYLNTVMRIAAYDMGHGFERKALERLHFAQQKAPYSEEICRLVLANYALQRDFASLSRYYEAFVQLLHTDLGIEPSQETTSIYNQYV